MQAKRKVENKKHQIGLYIRVSTEEQAQNPEGSIKSQEQRLRSNIDLRNQEFYLGDITRVYIDRAKSGKDKNRPELQRLLRDIQNREITLVAVSELSRLSRSIKDFSEMWEMMQAHGCGFLSLRENFDTTSAAGEMVLYTVANIAQFERRQCSERVKANFEARAERGLFNGGSVPFGFRFHPEKKGYLVIHEEEAKTVCEIFKTFLREGCTSAAGKSLNERGIKLSRYKQGGGNHPRLEYFTPDNLYGILSNRAYIGLRVYQSRTGETKTSKAVWDPIIDEITFERVKTILKKNRYRLKSPNSKRFPFLLSGLVTCGTCKDRLPGKSAHGNGGKIPYYEHGWATKRQAFLNKKVFTCSPHRILAKIIEPLVWEQIQSLMTHPEMVHSILAESRNIFELETPKAELEKLKQKQIGIEDQLEALAEHLTKIPKGVSPLLIFNQMKKLEELRAEYFNKIQLLEKEQGLSDPPASLKDYQSLLQALKLFLAKNEKQELKNKIALKLIEKVEVFPDRVQIYFKIGKSCIFQGIAQMTDQPWLINPEKQGSPNFLPNGSNTIDFGRGGEIRTHDLFVPNEAR